MTRHVAPQELARVANPEALAKEPDARICVQIARAWVSADAPLDLVITAPRRLSCARCEGGGCDACARSGVLRAPEDEAARKVSARIPAATLQDLALRIPHPFGMEHAIQQVIVEIRFAEEASPNVARVQARPRSKRLPLAFILVLLALAALLAAVLAQRA